MRQPGFVGHLMLAALLLTPLRLAGQTGDLRVVVVTSGSRIDDNGYVAVVDTLRRAVGVNDTVVFTGVKVGIQTAQLLDLAESCRVTEGNARKAVVRLSTIAELQFDVACGGPSQPTETRAPPESPVESPTHQDEPPDSPSEARSETPRPSSIGDFSVGRWVAAIEPPGFPSYPVNMTLNPDQSVGQTIGRADYDAESWSCSYDLVLESARNDDLVVMQKLTIGDCPDGIRVVLARQGEDLQARWLQSDGGLWFEAVFVRSD
jgi:hypothetical protein